MTDVGIAEIDQADKSKRIGPYKGMDRPRIRVQRDQIDGGRECRQHPGRQVRWRDSELPEVWCGLNDLDRLCQGCLRPRNEFLPGAGAREERAAREGRLGKRVQASQGPPKLMEHGDPVLPCQLDRQRGDPLHLRHH
jgi:hypothetical protein